jgi:ATP-dependent helicase/DNAse subunit B
VIPFLRLPELKSIIRETRSKIGSRMEEYEKAINTLNKLQDYRQSIFTQLQLIEQAKKSMMWKLLS